MSGTIFRQGRTALRFAAVAAACLFATGCAARDGGEASPPARIPWDGRVEVSGALREMLHEGRTDAAVRLDELLPDPGLQAVGALAGLAGEVTISDGQVWLSYPDGDRARIETPAHSDAGAALLVFARVRSWRSVRAEAAIPFERLDDEVSRLAREAGMSPGARFPFQVEGTFEDLRWHVIDGARLSAGPHTHEDHLTAAVKGRSARAPALLVGFWSDRDEGVFTRRGSRTHVHCVVAEPPASGHVDHILIPEGAVFRFPE